MTRPEIEEFSRKLDPDVTEAVRAASKKLTVARIDGLAKLFVDPVKARNAASKVKGYVIDHLKDLLVEFESRCLVRGIKVHWATDAASARATILDICKLRAEPGSTIVKGKSMATEEIHLNASLLEAGYDVVETDLGEFVVQLDDDTPSHIVAPIIHKRAAEVSGSFARAGLGEFTTDATQLAKQARAHLREKFRTASVGISGVNFAIAETGRIVLVENEGNNRFSTTAPKTHIALMGIEKILPSERDLPLFLKLLSGSATGQRLAVYIHLISASRLLDELDGPEEVHLVLLDNGRSNVLAGPYRDILRCIRCGACLNVCPVYRQVSGHGYRHVYSGPLGAILAPALEGVSRLGHLAKASTLCGACVDACPVLIPIPDLLLKMRSEVYAVGPQSGGIPWHWFALVATNEGIWKRGLKMLPLASSMPNRPTRQWSEFREPPKRIGREFRRWWRERSR